LESRCCGGWDGVITTASSVHLYVNGVLIYLFNCDNGASIVSDASSNFFIGNDGTSARTFDGTIDYTVVLISANSKQIIEDLNGTPTAGFNWYTCRLLEV